jgi:hypothetical protein
VNDLLAKEYSNVKMGKIMRMAKSMNDSQENSIDLNQDLHKEENIWQEIFEEFKPLFIEKRFDI